MPNTLDGRLLYRIEEAAEILGCSRTHIYALIARDLLRVVDIKKPENVRSKSRIRADDLREYVERNTVKSVA